MSNNDISLEIYLEEFPEDKIEQILEAWGLTAEDNAAMICPVDTGRLRNSINHEVALDENAVYVGTNVYYAAYVELGHINAKTFRQSHI